MNAWVRKRGLGMSMEKGNWRQKMGGELQGQLPFER